MVTQIGSIFKTTTDTTTAKTQSAFDGSVDTFLQLFMAQLKNQDPTQPFSTESMTQQMSMLTQTQQSIQSNKNLEQLIASNANSQASAVTSLVNKDVSFRSSSLYASDTGAEFNFEIPTATTVKVQITNQAGDLVYDSTGKMDAGKSTFVWDRIGNNGVANPVGKYNIKVSTLGANSKYTEVPVTVKGKVTGVDFTTNGDPTLIIGSGANKLSVTLDKVGYVS
jgi:flagellar basal-body rod modification protein FlgD